MSDTKDIKFAERTKPSPGDVEPKPLEQPEQPKQPEGIKFKRFPNGMVLGFSANPRKAGTWVIHDATGTPFAIALNPHIADLICNSVTFFFHEQDKIKVAQLKTIESLSEAADVTEPGNTDELTKEAAVPFVPVVAKPITPETAPAQ